MLIAKNIERIEECIYKACLRSGRKREEITLMAVTKNQPLEAVGEAWKAGICCFGESKVQEAVAKYANAKYANAPCSGHREQYPGMELHLVGSLQMNKAKQAVMLFDCIQSLDRESLAGELAKCVSQRNNPLPVLLEFRTGEDSKSGFTSIDELSKATELTLACPKLRIRGLMTIAPNTSDKKLVRAAFRRLVKVRHELEKTFPGCWPCLSMGMSGDYEIAIEEGSTLLRIGSIIFGEWT